MNGTIDALPPARLAGRAAGLLTGAALLAGSVTVLFLVMRRVMDVGGFCAEGGAYEIRQPCPEGVAALAPISIFGIFVGLGVYAWSARGTGFLPLLLLGWPALFLSLGWNFLEYGFDPPEGGGVAPGWLLCGVVFVLMGGVPLVGAVATLRANLRRARNVGPSPAPTPAVLPAPPPPTDGGGDGNAGGDGGNADDDGGDGDVAAALERLATLHRRGDLADAEYEAAVRAALEEP